MSDDLPEQPDGYELVYPFVVCRSNGGPYEDKAFVAGVQAGRLDHALAAASALGIDSARFTVVDALVPQVELIGMNRGFPMMQVKSQADGWSLVEFHTQEPAS